MGAVSLVNCYLKTDGHTYSNAGTYNIHLAYHVGCCIEDSTTIKIVVLPLALTIQPHDLTMTYGDPAPNFTAPEDIDYIGLKQGDTVTGLTRAAYTQFTTDKVDPSTAPIGDYRISCGNASAPAYTINYKVGTLHIVQAQLTIKAKDQTTTYGAADQFDRSTNSMTFSGFKNGESPSVLGSGLTITSNVTATSPVGTYTLTPSGANDTNYFFNYQPGTLRVDPAGLTVTADDLSRSFGADNPPLTATLSGFVNGQTLATSGVTGQAACTTTAKPWSAVGSYPIVCTIGTLAAANYKFVSFVPGTLKVTSTAPCVTGTIPGKLTVASGQVICLAPGAQVSGPVKVEAGGALDVEGATISGPVTASGAAIVRLCGVTVDGALTISGTTGLVLVGGDAATGACAPNTIGGKATLTDNNGGVELNGNTINGALTISNTSGSLPPPDTGSVHALGNNVAGKVKIQP